MKVYLVGGAVRDKLLNYPVSENDWVVVGATPDELITNGFKQVGKDFPVFLHPETKDEYALARTEKKSGVGYYGFICDYKPTVSLEEDLSRRDLTINAIAMTQDGDLIDPFNGQHDLDNKVLRHVSAAFIEDPLRVLRVARFAARYYHLGFSIANSTMQLMRKIVRSGELSNLNKERVWQELQKSLLSQNPEIFFCVLRECGALYELFPEIDKLFGVPLAKASHPEVDAGVHMLMTLCKSAEKGLDLSVRFAAVTHKLGKVALNSLCGRLGVPTKLSKFAGIATGLRVPLQRLFELSCEDIIATMERADAFRRPELFLNLIKFSEIDYKSRGVCGEYPLIPWFFPSSTQHAVDNVNYKQAKFWESLLVSCQKIKVAEIVAKGLKGVQIKSELRLKRIECIQNIKKLWEKDEK